MKNTGKNPLFALALRTFVHCPEGQAPTMAVIDEQTRLLREVVNTAMLIKRGDAGFFERIDIVIPIGKNHSHPDYGGSLEVLSREFADNPRVHVSAFAAGDMYCALVNHTVAEQYRNGITHTVILSKEAVSCLTQNTCEKIAEAVNDGALVVGVAVREIAELVVEGVVANTFACWNCQQFLAVGGANLMFAKPKPGDSVTYWTAWDEDKQEDVRYHPSGMDEVGVLVELILEHGECVAIIMPDNTGTYEVDEVIDPQRAAWEAAKWRSKMYRLLATLSHYRKHPSFLLKGIMSKYHPQL